MGRLVRMHQFDPLRPLSWRWNLACQLVEQRRRVSARHADDWIRSAVRFRRRLERSKSPAAMARLHSAEPGLFGAYETHGRGGFGRWRLEAWLLSGLSMPAVAAKADIPVGVVEAYEALLFNISDRLHASDYIHTYAIGRSTDADEPISVETAVKAFAYYAGPLVLEVLLRDAVDDHGNLRPLDDLDLRTAACRTAMRARLAVMIEMRPFSPAVISEMVRIRELMQRFERDEDPKASLNLPTGVLEEALMAASRNVLDDDDAQDGHEKDPEERKRWSGRRDSESDLDRAAA